MIKKAIPLGEILEETNERLGQRPEPEVLTLTEKNGFVSQRERFNKRLAVEDTNGYKVVRRFDVAFNPYLLWAGAVAQNVNWDEGVISPLYPTFRLRTGYEPRYVDRLLRSPGMVARYDSIAFGSVPRRRRTSVADFLGLEIAKPPSLAEQRRIAEILDKADELLAKRRVALSHLDTLTESIFLDMFGDPTSNPKGWPRMELQDLFDIARGGSPRPIDDFITDANDGINWIMIGDASEAGKYITKTKKRIRPEGARRSRRVSPGDFLLTNSMSFGRPYIMKTSGCIHDGWLVLSPKTIEFEADYFYTLLGSRALFVEFERRAPGATVKNLNIDLVRSVTVPVAPLKNQKQFSRAVAAIESASRPLNASLEDLTRLFAALQHRAFRGEL